MAWVGGGGTEGEAPISLMTPSSPLFICIEARERTRLRGEYGVGGGGGDGG